MSSKNYANCMLTNIFKFKLVITSPLITITGLSFRLFNKLIEPAVPRKFFSFINLIFAIFLISFVVLFISLNLEKKYLSEATLVIAQDENKFTDIEEAYSQDAISNRVNNQMAILKSDEVMEFIVNDEKNTLEFKKLYSTKKKKYF